MLLCIGVLHILTTVRHQAHCQSSITILQNSTLPSNVTVQNSTLPSNDSVSSTLIPIPYVINSLLIYNVTSTRAVNTALPINATMAVNNEKTSIPDIFNSSATSKTFYSATTTPVLLASTSTTTRTVNRTLYNIKPTAVLGGISPNKSEIRTNASMSNVTLNISTSPSHLFTVLTSAINGSFNMSPCYEKENWIRTVYDVGLLCLTHACAERMFERFDLYMTCNDWSVTTEVQVIGGYVNKYGIMRAEQMVVPIGMNPIKRTYVRQTTSHFTIEYGFIRRRFLTNHKPVPFPHLSFNEAQVFSMPPTVMNADEVAYVYNKFFLNVYKHNEQVDFVKESTPLTSALFLLDGSRMMASVANVINSDIISVLTLPRVTSFSEYVDIMFEYRDYKGTINHKCVHAPGHLGQVQWTDAGCYAVLVEMRQIHCRCSSPSSNFAVLSELYVEPHASKPFVQIPLTKALVVISIAGALVCFVCLLLPPCVGCSYIGGMIRIYRYSDLTQAAEYIIFIIGIYSRRHETASSLIAVVLHFLHCSVMFWALVEGLYLHHKVKPHYHPSSGTMFFYSTLVFGGSAALTGAVSGYKFQFGTNIQYVWMKTNGVDFIYFIIPIAVLVLITISVDWLLIMQLKNWIGFHDDYVYTRAPYFIRRQSAFVAVCLVTFILGNMSMVEDGAGSMAYMFAAFFIIQFICRFYSHFIWNYEVWDWKKFNEANLLEQDKGIYFEKPKMIKREHTIMTMELSSSSDESECEEEVIEVERQRQRPTSVHTYASHTSTCEMEEKPVTPHSKAIAVVINRDVDPKLGTIETMETMEVEKEEKAPVPVRMTKSQSMRLMKLEEEKKRVEDEKRQQEEKDKAKEKRELTRKMSRRQSTAGMMTEVLIEPETLGNIEEH